MAFYLPVGPEISRKEEEENMIKYLTQKLEKTLKRTDVDEESKGSSGYSKKWCDVAIILNRLKSHFYAYEKMDGMRFYKSFFGNEANEISAEWAVSFHSNNPRYRDGNINKKIISEAFIYLNRKNESNRPSIKWDTKNGWTYDKWAESVILEGRKGLLDSLQARVGFKNKIFMSNTQSIPRASNNTKELRRLDEKRSNFNSFPVGEKQLSFSQNMFKGTREGGTVFLDPVFENFPNGSNLSVFHVPSLPNKTSSDNIERILGLKNGLSLREMANLSRNSNIFKSSNGGNIEKLHREHGVFCNCGECVSFRLEDTFKPPSVPFISKLLKIGTCSPDFLLPQRFSLDPIVPGVDILGLTPFGYEKSTSSPPIESNLNSFDSNDETENLTKQNNTTRVPSYIDPNEIARSESTSWVRLKVLVPDSMNQTLLVEVPDSNFPGFYERAKSEIMKYVISSMPQGISITKRIHGKKGGSRIVHYTAKIRGIKLLDSRMEPITNDKELLTRHRDVITIRLLTENQIRRKGRESRKSRITSKQLSSQSTKTNQHLFICGNMGSSYIHKSWTKGESNESSDNDNDMSWWERWFGVTSSTKNAEIEMENEKLTKDVTETTTVTKNAVSGTRTSTQTTTVKKSHSHDGKSKSPPSPLREKKAKSRSTLQILETTKTSLPEVPKLESSVLVTTTSTDTMTTPSSVMPGMIEKSVISTDTKTELVSISKALERGILKEKSPGVYDIPDLPPGSSSTLILGNNIMYTKPGSDSRVISINEEQVGLSPLETNGTSRTYEIATQHPDEKTVICHETITVDEKGREIKNVECHTQNSPSENPNSYDLGARDPKLAGLAFPLPVLNIQRISISPEFSVDKAHYARGFYDEFLHKSIPTLAQIISEMDSEEELKQFMGPPTTSDPKTSNVTFSRAEKVLVEQKSGDQEAIVGDGIIAKDSEGKLDEEYELLRLNLESFCLVVMSNLVNYKDPALGGSDDSMIFWRKFYYFHDNSENSTKELEDTQLLLVIVDTIVKILVKMMTHLLENSSVIEAISTKMEEKNELRKSLDRLLSTKFAHSKQKITKIYNKYKKMVWKEAKDDGVEDGFSSKFIPIKESEMLSLLDKEEFDKIIPQNIMDTFNEHKHIVSSILKETKEIESRLSFVLHTEIPFYTEHLSSALRHDNTEDTMYRWFKYNLFTLQSKVQGNEELRIMIGSLKFWINDDAAKDQAKVGGKSRHSLNDAAYATALHWKKTSAQHIPKKEKPNLSPQVTSRSQLANRFKASDHNLYRASAENANDFHRNKGDIATANQVMTAVAKDQAIYSGIKNGWRVYLPNSIVNPQ